jgi:acetolactate decarboxylase
MIDRRFTESLHVSSLRRLEAYASHDPHVLFQASTIGALMEGRLEGDLTVGELAGQGTLGLGTFDGLDGEMIVIDGLVLRADVDGHVSEAEPARRTPFAVVVDFEAEISLDLHGPIDHAGLLAAIESALPAGSSTCAIRIEGEFACVRARSVPRQKPPYRSLDEVAREQHVFELENLAGTMVGFRFPDHAAGIELPGFHLHFVSADRTRGGHVLDARARGARIELDLASSLQVELPAGVDLDAPELHEDAKRALRAAEGG